MAFAEDFGEFFDGDDFAVTGTLTPAGYPHPSSKTISVDGIFDNATIEVNDMAGVAPMFVCSTDDVADIDVGAKATINDIDYVVQSPPHHDGTGVTTIVLERP